VHFFDRLRDEIKFPSVEALRCGEVAKVFAAAGAEIVISGKGDWKLITHSSQRWAPGGYSHIGM
jgi:hypothetical protein